MPRLRGTIIQEYRWTYRSNYSEICKEPILSTEDEVRLFTEYKDPKTPAARKEEIRTQVINSNLRFAFNEAKKFAKGDTSLFRGVDRRCKMKGYW